jgi:hypothetical protein
MAMIQRTLVLNSVTLSDNVANARMGIGANLDMVQALATLSQFWPEPTGPEPTAPMPRKFAMVGKDYRDLFATRAGRSARPSECHPSDLAEHSARLFVAITTKRQPFAALAFALNLGLCASEGRYNGR